jgi:hypothetical protein
VTPASKQRGTRVRLHGIPRSILAPTPGSRLYEAVRAVARGETHRLTAAERFFETELKRRGVEVPSQQRVGGRAYGAPEIVSAIGLFLVLRHFLLRDQSRPPRPLHRLSVRDCHSTARAFDLSENDVCRCVATFMRRLGRRSLEDAFTGAKPLAPRVAAVLREARLWLSESAHVWLPRK